MLQIQFTRTWVYILTVATRGKKRASSRSEPETSLTKRSASSSLSPPSSDSEADSPARAETRKCPVCAESIPLRLLARHALLETERVDDIVQKIGSAESVESLDDFQVAGDTRRSALKARKSFRSHTTDTIEQATKIIQTIKRHRKQRHTRLRDLTRDIDDEPTASRPGSSRDPFASGSSTERMECPVCINIIQGDADVLEAHIDACLADQARREEAAAAMDETEGVGHIGDVTGTNKVIRLTSEILKSSGKKKGTGFHTRNPGDRDVEDDVDIDGDDLAVYGEAQFTEGDLITLAQDREPNGLNTPDEDEIIEIDSDVDEDCEHKSLHELVAEGKVNKRTTKGDGVDAVRAKMNEVMGIGDTERLDLAIAVARNKGDKTALIVALESKVKLLESMRVASTTSLLCRICLDPYTEPTVSTGCWHTCCRECWLRCLGSTKLCPICKRITSATDLRRIYL
ncbi:hypothetical protein M378DRAFT_67947 [Amanita muscaria Koide BX008]|uniref:RING-type domain-containing protein n=1 Tax=Amanita muscaria (strain Koide BX008) TaxID=946122 RepID=A0A0C2TSK9_AMAMK|nr:hypothetical protein M378DRAFT_67947 [Amanita muscaria Koide BX008]